VLELLLILQNNAFSLQALRVLSYHASQLWLSLRLTK